VSSFSLSGRFSGYSLSKLEELGMPVLKVMAAAASRVKEAVRLDLEEEENKLTMAAGREGVAAVLEFWRDGKGSRPPTWRSLIEVLREISEEKLSQEIESYLLGQLVVNVFLCGCGGGTGVHDCVCIIISCSWPCFSGHQVV